MLKKLRLAALLVLPIFWQAAEAETPPNVFVDALKNGRATAPMPDDPKFAGVKQAIQSKTGDSGGLFIAAFRVAKFKQQPRCGRVAFMISQPTSNIAWSDLGGQINICEDGTPPWQVCTENPSKLVPPSSKCANQSSAQDTKEIQEAIANAIAHGSLSKEEAKKKYIGSMRAPEEGTKQ